MKQTVKIDISYCRAEVSADAVASGEVKAEVSADAVASGEVKNG